MAVASVKTGTGKNNVSPALVDPDSDGNVIVLAANAVKSIVVPTDADQCIFSCESSFWADTATISTVSPIAEVTDGTGPHLNPAGFANIAEDTVYLRSKLAATVMVQFYKKSGQA